jgi:antitoxin (DNA-binding transcriptional repressor) of toxin-antitoxin stability system
MQYSLTEAKARLSKLLDQVEQGEEVIIVRNGRPVARFQYLGTRSSSVVGQHQGEVEPPDDSVFAAMSDEEADAFLEGR